MDPEAGGWRTKTGVFLSLMQGRKIQSALCNSIWNGKLHLRECVSRGHDEYYYHGHAYRFL